MSLIHAHISARSLRASAICAAAFAVSLALAPPAIRSLAFAAPAPAQDADLIPRAVFFGNPDRANVQISPDGTQLSFLAPHNNVMNIWVQTIGQDDAHPVTTSTQRPIRMYQWAHNNQQIIYLQDRGGDENYHAYAVDLAGGSEIELTPFEGARAEIVADDRHFPDEILIAINNRNPQLHDVWRISTRTGQGQVVFQNDAGYVGMLADSEFNVRLASKVLASGGSVAYMRDSAEADWYELASWGLEDSQTSGPLGFDREGKIAYVMDSRGSNTGCLHAYDTTPADGPQYVMLACNPKADLGNVVFDPLTGKPQAAAFEYGRVLWTVLDPAIQPDWDYLSSVNAGEMNIASRDHADRRWVVSYMIDDGPVKFYLYDRDKRHATYLFSNRSELENLPLAKMQPVVIPARDGLEMVSYLTLPPNGKENLPMVLLVHGGPWARDRWGYNGLHQWLASRGYAVLSVNYRGSTGFGKAFLNAGNREWGRRMHDDLIDAVIWACDQKIADPDKVAIMGGSYGGYATLVGLTFTPDFFACGVDIVGPSHLRTLLETIPPYWAPIKAMFEQRMGSLGETQFLDSISPLTKADQITRPLLIGQGKNDPRVKEAESQQIVRAMQEKNLPVTYVMFPDEGHGFARAENNLAFFAITEAFLAQHLGGKYEPIGSEVRQSSAKVEAGDDLVPGLKEAIGQ
jgi:dipeptidyl aminopeptidase/acylaminoacyl peptidase